MKKLLKIMLGVAIMTTLIGCGTSTDVNEETYNGITKVVTTTTKGNETTTEITYKDENGNILDADEGEAAFLAAKDAIENPQPEEEETEELEVYEASLTFVNETEADIVEMYMPLAEDDSWGNNIISDDYVFAANTQESLDGTVTYDAQTAFNFSFVTSDGDSIEFDAFYLNCADPENVIVAITESDGSYYVETR